LDEALAAHLGEDGVVLHLEDSQQSGDLELERRVAYGPPLVAAVEAVLGAGSCRCDVVRRKAPERRPFSRERAAAADGGANAA
jgi:hypothetical protein